MLTPVQYSMGHSRVHLERADWNEPTITWPLLHSSSGTRKSVIHNFIQELSMFNIEEDDSPHPTYKVNETTFENLGIVMEGNNGQVIWYFDEARHFFAQLGMYQKGSPRDESALLSLYDGGSWDHGTSNKASAKFSMERTNLLGGLTQTAQVINLFGNKDQMQSGLIPRFLALMLEPVHPNIRTLVSGSDDLRKLVKTKISTIYDSHHDDDGRKYYLLRESKTITVCSLQRHCKSLSHSHSRREK